VAIAVDGTKLHAELRPMWDKDLQQHVLIGGDDGRVPVADSEEFERILANGEVQLASKVCYALLHKARTLAVS
jgi:hypothetical protein